MKFKYVAENDPDGFEYAYDFEYTFLRKPILIDLTNSISIEYLSEAIAEDYHSKHNGWESCWPCDFTIWQETGEPVGIFTVEREHRPEFSAVRIK